MTTISGGTIGSWFAKADGEELPCVHQEWFKFNNGKPYYRDPGYQANDSKWTKFIDAIKEKKRVILTEDILLENGGFKRAKYKSVWKVDNITIHENSFCFDFVDKVTDVK